MDPFTILQAAGSIVQFIDFTGKLISKGHRIYQSADGNLVENAELEAITRNIIALNNNIAKSIPENTKVVAAGWPSIGSL
jgi:hypothetical protein